MNNNTPVLKTNLTDYNINQTENKAIKFDIDCIGFGYSEVLPIDTIITDSTIDLKKIKMFIVGDNSIFIISDELYTDKEFIRPEFEYFDNFQFYEVVAIPSKDVNVNVNNIVNTLETSPKGIIENEIIKEVSKWITPLI